MNNKPSAKVITHSSFQEDELITFEIELHRFILPEFNTHRCVTADTELWFDLPNNGKPKLYKMTVGDFYNKWVHGAKEHVVGSKQEYSVKSFSCEDIVTAKEISIDCGLSASAIRLACRKGICKSQNPNKVRSDDFKIKVSDFNEYRESIGLRTFPLKSKLEAMQLRMLNEDTNEIQNTNITDIWVTGVKKVYELRVGGFKLKATADHPILTDSGWKELGDLTKEDYVLTCGFGLNNHKDPLQHKKIDGQWTAVWNRQNKETILERQKNVCGDCGESFKDYDIHHIDPVYTHPEKAFDLDNVVALCKECHNQCHDKQGWQVSNKLIGKPVKVDTIIYCGEEVVYDLTVESNFHNFIANGIVVHNCFSRNFQSSRAVPVKKIIEQVSKFPALPVHWGKNQAGMVAEEELDPVTMSKALIVWKKAANQASLFAEEMDRLGVHKQIVNRLLEPFMWTKGVVTVTGKDLEGFFKLRCHKDAQPEIKALADCMFEAYQLSKPTHKDIFGYHLPYVSQDDIDNYGIEDLVKISASCCAQVSYRTLDTSIEKARKIYGMLNLPENGEYPDDPPHFSPTEHQAVVENSVFERDEFTGNFGESYFKQYRKFLEQGKEKLFTNLEEMNRGFA